MALPINIEQLISGKSVEWERLEFKGGWNPEDILHTICAFANDINNWGGGYIIVGIDEDNGIPILPPVGLQQNQFDGIQKELVELCHLAEPYIQVVSEPVPYMDKHILVIWVPGGSERPYKAPTTLGAKGQKRYYIRSGSVSKIANKQEEERLFALASKIPFDDRINHEAEIEELNLGIIREYLHEVQSELSGESIMIPFKDLCWQMQIIGGTTEYVKPKNIGLLMFSNKPEKRIPCARIELVHFLNDDGDAFNEKIFTGPIHKQLKDVLAYFKQSVIEERVTKVPMEEKANRCYNYPYEAIEEAVANAVYHKSYDKRAPIEIRIYENFIEILSFEGPMPPITQSDLTKERISNRFYRNRRIGDFLKELHLTEGRSTGFPKIYKHIRKNGSPEPKFETDDQNSYFLTTFYIHPAFIKLDEVGKKVVEFCKTPRSIREILTELGLSYHSKNINKIIQPLKDAGVIKPTEDSEHSKNNKYISVV